MSRTLRWVVVIVPCLAIAGLDLVTDHEWNDLISSPVNTLLVPVLALLGSTVFALFAFRRIDHLDAAVRERDAALAQKAAVCAEQDRIAREMHDGLAQVLGYVNTKAQAVEEHLALGRPEEARAQLAELAAAARSVYVDVREAILGLSTHVDRERGLVGALEDYAARFSEASKVAVTVEASPLARSVQLGDAAEIEVIHIAQEALTNVRKHATAQRVSLGIALADRDLVITVADDGVGLSSAGAPVAGDWPHYGMRMMRERAAAVGAVADWKSDPGRGTTFHLRVPVDRPAVGA